MREDTWFSADEAKAAGLADEVIPAVEIAAYFDVYRYPKAPAALRAKAPVDQRHFYARRSARPPVDKNKLAASIKSAFDSTGFAYSSIYARRAK
jgi:hypothetical protein